MKGRKRVRQSLDRLRRSKGGVLKNGFDKEGENE